MCRFSRILLCAILTTLICALLTNCATKPKPPADQESKNTAVTSPPAIDPEPIVKLEPNEKVAPPPSPKPNGHDRKYPDTPNIFSIHEPISSGSAVTLKISGTGADKGSIVELLNFAGKVISSVPVSVQHVSPSDGQTISVTLPSGIKSGKYSVRIRNSSGHYSNKKRITIKVKHPVKPVAIKPVEVCTKSFSQEPHVLYLGGGDAANLFQRYLSQNTGVRDKLRRDLKVKFFRKQKGSEDFVLQEPICLNDMEQLFIESQQDFLKKLANRLKGKSAEFCPALPGDAFTEKADYLQCRNQ